MKRDLEETKSKVYEHLDNVRGSVLGSFLGSAVKMGVGGCSERRRK